MTPSAATYNKSSSGDSRFIGARSWRSCCVAWSVLALVVLLSSTQASTAISLAIKPAVVQQEPSFVPDSELFSGILWRNIGPDRGGRSIAVAGHRERPLEYFFGATGGGLWKTSDGGITWRPMTDAQIGSSSVGSVAIAESDADIVWMGTGEGQLRGNIMQGDGIYKSGDAGITWTHMGLRESRVIARIRIHPSDPDTVYAAVLGDPYQDTPERGIYKTSDGGTTWNRVLFKSEKAGAIDLAMDPNDPQTLYATMWQVYRRPYRLWSGGSDSAVYKTTDGGLTWFELTRNPGLPAAGPLGKMGITVSPVDSGRVYLLIEPRGRRSVSIGMTAVLIGSTSPEIGRSGSDPSTSCASSPTQLIATLSSSCRQRCGGRRMVVLTIRESPRRTRTSTTSGSILMIPTV